jgi:hypothetical protein
MSVAVLAALMAVSMVGAAGCTKRKSKSGRSSSGAAGPRTDPTGRSSPSPAASDPAGASCADTLASVNSATRLTWTLDDDKAASRDKDRAQAGSRHCYFETPAAGTVPEVNMAVTFYRIDRRVDRTADDVKRRAAEYVKCTEPLASPPSGVTLAVQCLEKQNSTLFNVNTLYSGPTGYVLVWVSMKRSTTALHTRARELGRQTVGVTYDLI